MQMLIPGGTAALYDDIMNRMDQRTAADFSDGAILHIACVPEDGLRVVDVWESEAKFGAFLEARLGPAYFAAGGPPFDPPAFMSVRRCVYDLTRPANVTFTIDIPGATVEMYDQMVEKGGLYADDNLADGQAVHISAQIPGGMRFVDVWESEDAWNGFVGAQMANIQSVGFPQFDPPTLYPVHLVMGR
jgi:hypothetical protein